MNMKKRIISTLLLSTVALSIAAAPVAGVSANTDSDIAKQDATIASAQSAKAEAESQMKSLQSKVDSLQSQQTDTKNQIAKLQEQAKQLNKQLATLNQNIQERTEALQAQARSAQVNSSATSYLNAVLDSKSITDAVQKITAMATVTSANQKMLDAQKKDEQDLKDKSADMQKNYNQFVELSKNLDDQAQELNAQKANLQVATVNYQLTITTAQDKKNSLLAEKAAAEAAAKKAAEQQAAYEAAQQASTTAQSKGNSSSNSTTTSNSGNSGSSNSGGTSSNNNSGSNSGNNGGSTQPTPPSSSTTPPSTSKPTPSTPTNNPYAGGGCTDFVWQYFAARGIYIGNIMPGNGGDWATYGVSQGVLHTVAPAPGVIASAYTANFCGYAGSPYGHVAIVTAVHADGTFDVIEGGLSGGWWNHVRTNLSPAGVTFLYPNA